jgi:hypothetical protein
LVASSNLSVYLSNAVKTEFLSALFAKFNSSAEIAPVNDLRVDVPFNTKSLTFDAAPDNLSPNNPESLKVELRATALST